MDKKHRFTLHVNMDDFIPATDEEKSYIVQMRPSTTFFKKETASSSYVLSITI